MNPNVLITGHSRGLGRAFADTYKDTHNIIGVSSSEIDFLTLTQTPEYYLNNTYDIVFINARTTKHSWSDLMNINCVNQVKFALDIKDNIKKALVFITSRASNLTRTFRGFKGPDGSRIFGGTQKIDYGMSKAALTYAAVCISRHVSYPVLAIDPGNFANQANPNRETKPAEIAQHIKKLLDKNDLKRYDGRLVRYTGELLEW